MKFGYLTFMFMRMFIDPNICIMFFIHTKWSRISSINWINCQIIQYMELWNYCTQVSLVDWSWWNFAFILRHNRILWSLLMPFCLSCLSVFLWTFGMLFFPYFFLEFLLSRFSWRKKSSLFCNFPCVSCIIFAGSRAFCFTFNPIFNDRFSVFSLEYAANLHILNY